MPTISTSRVELHVFRRESGRIFYLALHHAVEEPALGAWGILDGEITAQETPEHAALCLLRAETGLSPLGLWTVDFVHTHYDPQTRRLFLIPTFAVEVAEDAVVRISPTYNSSRWISYEQALELMRLNSHREGLKYVYSDIVAAPDRGALFRLPLE